MISPDTSFTFTNISGLFDSALPPLPYPFGTGGKPCPCLDCADDNDTDGIGASAAGAPAASEGTREVFDLAAVSDALIRVATEGLSDREQVGGRIAAIAEEVVTLHTHYEADNPARVAQHAVQISVNALALAFRAVGACEVEKLLTDFETMLTGKLRGVKPSAVVKMADRFRTDVEALRASAA